jgi:NADH-quinone oxidoreductase subunit J
LFVLLGAEFLAMILVVVYVGAVAVLFLFVVMMLDINFALLREGFMRYLPVGGAVGLVLLAELVFVGMAWIDAAGSAQLRGAPMTGGVDNTRALGRLIYTHYALVFQAAGLVLLVAMIGAIVLTLRQRPGVKRQDIGRQLARTRESGVEIVKPRTGV